MTFPFSYLNSVGIMLLGNAFTLIFTNISGFYISQNLFNRIYLEFFGQFNSLSYLSKILTILFKILLMWQPDGWVDNDVDPDQTRRLIWVYTVSSGMSAKIV